MADILCIESSAKNCSVAWSSGGEVLFIKEKTGDKYFHAEALHGFVRDLLDQAGKLPHAVAVSKGPGSYTGLRIGVSAAKGLCFAWHIPLISVGTLDALARYGALHFPSCDKIIPMIDARRMEIYTAVFDISGKMLSDAPFAMVLDHFFFQSFSDDEKILVIGDGAGKSSAFARKGKIEILDISPSASMLALPAEEKFNHGEFEDVAYFEPFYLKEFLPGKPKTPLSFLK